ncbi:MAG: hypothetical protein JWQ81_8560 [Amycolatopsis sp.]|nr:hypothetical protein [Amycolatopsis sp.]
MKNPLKTIAAAIKEAIAALDESMPQLPQPAPKPKGRRS